MIAHLLGPDLGAEYQFNDWPLHVTLLPWFRAEGGVDERISNVVEDMRACRVYLGAKILGPVALYGVKEDIPVRPIGNSTQLGIIHGMLLREFHSTLENRDFIGGNYNPHLTIRDNEDPGEGFEFLVDKFSLVRHDGTHKTVVLSPDLVGANG